MGGGSLIIHLPNAQQGLQFIAKLPTVCRALAALPAICKRKCASRTFFSCQ
jgi:hypothetical protein